jgi:hypothetical protein
MPTTNVKYTLTRGLPWTRRICVKSKLTHYRVNVNNPTAYVAVTSSNKKQLTTEVMAGGDIKLSLDKIETRDLPVGVLTFDVWADVTIGVRESVYQPVATGTIAVSSYDNVTPLEDTSAMEIRYKQRTDYRRVFTWEDEDGDILTIQDAYLQADDSNGTTVLDLRWYATTPSEETVIALSPANKRGYLAPSTGASLEMHISDTNNIAAGSYPFELFVKDSVGDWECLVQGTIVVESSISSPPA